MTGTYFFIFMLVAVYCWVCFSVYHHNEIVFGRNRLFWPWTVATLLWCGALVVSAIWAASS